MRFERKGGSGGVLGQKQTAKGASIFLRCVSDGDGGREGGWGTAAAVQTVALPAEKHEPVDLWRQDAQAAQRGGCGQMEGHGVEGDAIVPAIHPVHIREESNAAREEGEQHHAAIGFVQPAVLKSELQGESGESRCYHGLGAALSGSNIVKKLGLIAEKWPSSRTYW